MKEEMLCAVCGADFWIDTSGCSHHWGDTIDDIDYDLDADHVPYAADEDETEDAHAC